MISTIITLAALGAIGWSAWTIWTGYAAATGTPWERFFAAFQNLATIIWGHLMTVGGAASLLVGNAADLLGMPEVSAAIRQYVTPEMMQVIMAIGVVTVFLRSKTFWFEKPPEG